MKYDHITEAELEAIEAELSRSVEDAPPGVEFLEGCLFLMLCVSLYALVMVGLTL